MNDTGIMKHLWWLVSNNESLWVKWVNTKYLKHDSIWTVKQPLDCSWVYRKILKVKHFIEPNVLTLIGNGNCTKLWLDKWHIEGVLGNIYGEGRNPIGV